jgi:hypothetical protein
MYFTCHPAEIYADGTTLWNLSQEGLADGPEE